MPHCTLNPDGVTWGCSCGLPTQGPWLRPLEMVGVDPLNRKSKRKIFNYKHAMVMFPVRNVCVCVCSLGDPLKWCFVTLKPQRMGACKRNTQVNCLPPNRKPDSSLFPKANLKGAPKKIHRPSLTGHMVCHPHWNPLAFPLSILGVPSCCHGRVFFRNPFHSKSNGK